MTFIKIKLKFLVQILINVLTFVLLLLISFHVYSIKLTGNVLAFKSLPYFLYLLVNDNNSSSVITFLPLLILILFCTLLFSNFYIKLFYHKNTLRLSLYFTIINIAFVSYCQLKSNFLVNQPVVFFSSLFFSDFNNYFFKVDLDPLKKSKFETQIYAKPLSNENKIKNVILILVDDLRKDHMSLYGYKRKTTPLLDSIVKAKNGVFFDNFHTNSSETVYSLINTFYSKSKGTINPNSLKLNDCLKLGGDFKTSKIVVGETKYGWRGTKKLLSNWDYQYSMEESPFSWANDKLIHYVLKNQPEYIFKMNKNFFFLHYFSCHYMGIFDRKMAKFKPANWNAIFNDNTENSKRMAINEYDSRIYQVDKYLNESLEHLNSMNLFENSLIIIYSDHGESFLEPRLEGKNHSHGKFIYSENINVPFIVFDPNKSINYNKSKNISTIDIAPSILDRLDLPTPSYWQGQSIYSTSNELYSFHQASYHQGVIYENLKSKINLKYIKNISNNYESLFDLTIDPTEKNNLINKPKWQNILKKMKKFFNEKDKYIP